MVRENPSHCIPHNHPVIYILCGFLNLLYKVPHLKFQSYASYIIYSIILTKSLIRDLVNCKHYQLDTPPA